jgi:lipopolysaccharide cholinephosphotransferase
MRSESQLMSELSHKTHYLRELTNDESNALKSAILDIYKDVAALCDKYGLVYMMSGGTCLGTIRHQGFIPWDDDLDIMLPRKYYDALINLLEKGELGEKYEFTYPNSNTDANTVFLKIFRKHTKDVELFNINTPFPKGIYIDVFALDAVPKYKWMRQIKGFIANAIQFIAMARLYVQYPSDPLKEYMYMDESLKKRYKLKMLLGKLASFASHAKWIYWFDKFVASDRDNRQWGIPTGRKYYNGEIFDKSVFVPVKKAMFEGLEVNVPNDTQIYLTNLYKNYMQLPPEDKRERHFIVEFKL